MCKRIMFMFPAEYHSDFPDSPLYSHWFLCGVWGCGGAGCFEARSSSVALVGLEFTQAGLEFVSHSASDIFFLHTFQHRKMSSDFHKQYFRSCIHQNTLTLLKVVERHQVADKMEWGGSSRHHNQFCHLVVMFPKRTYPYVQ